ncbi:MAG: hypothetical protein ACLGHL_01205 [Actinomycetota bacterium]
MRFAIEAWATEYGTPMELTEKTVSETKVDVEVERPVKDWAAIEPKAAKLPSSTLFTDGVRRIDARVWIETEDGTRPGVCASYAAGAMMCDGRARLAQVKVERGLFSAATDASSITCKHAHYGVRRAKGDAPEDLWLAIQERMGELEGAIADDLEADLILIDGPLRGNLGQPCRVGYVKTHHVSYLPPELDAVVSSLAPGQRTPVFLTLGRWGRFSWYVRLPGADGHSWAGVVRCETSADVPIEDATSLADTVATVLPRYASVSHKDPRAPQNLYPIAGLERELRRRLGDPQLLYRGLRVAAAV